MRKINHSILDGLRIDEAEKVAIVGVGNEMNGDDAAGLLVARSLQKKQAKDPAGACLPAGRVLIIDAGPSPEAFTGPLRRFAPGLLLIIDAAEMGEPAGTIRLFDWSEAAGMSGSTHTLPPSLLAKYLVAQIGCRVLLAGIQPAVLAPGQGISKEVRFAVTRLSRELSSVKHL